MDVLRRRADLLARIRQFFKDLNVFEVDPPLLGLTGVTDLHIDCITATCLQRLCYLQSSPEYFMKRLLAAGSGSIYSLGKVFRDDEAGRRHSPEFTLLEWYHAGWDEHQLMQEVRDLIRVLTPIRQYCKVSYGIVFEQVIGLDPHCSELGLLRQVASELSWGDWSNESRSTCLDLIFSCRVEPELPAGVVFIYNFPSCQAALAKLGTDEDGVLIARRFEVFVNQMELANGYFELTDPLELRQRFEADNGLRKVHGKPEIAIDDRLLAAMTSGLPLCAGVALGVDRLLMHVLGVKSIRDVLPFYDW